MNKVKAKKGKRKAVKAPRLPKFLRDAPRIDTRPGVELLLDGIKKHMPELKKLAEKADHDWGEEDSVYRFYHGSFKVYGLQDLTEAMVKLFREIYVPEDGKLNDSFEQIVKEGTGKNFSYEHNSRWLVETRPILEAYFHARYMVRQMIKYGSMKHAPTLLPSGWASVLYLYGMR